MLGDMKKEGLQEKQKECTTLLDAEYQRQEAQRKAASGEDDGNDKVSMMMQKLGCKGGRDRGDADTGKDDPLSIGNDGADRMAVAGAKAGREDQAVIRRIALRPPRPAR